MFSVGWGANQFSSLLVAYRDELEMSAQTRAFLFGVYAVGLVPALLVGGAASDRWGRRAVVLPFVVLSPLATVLLIVEHDSVPGLAVARLLAGACSGVVFAAASAWVAELWPSTRPPAPRPRGQRSSLSAGFGLGPLVAGLIGEGRRTRCRCRTCRTSCSAWSRSLLLLPAPGPRPERRHAPAAAPHPAGDVPGAVPAARRAGRAVGVLLRDLVRLPAGRARRPAGRRASPSRAC